MPSRQHETESPKVDLHRHLEGAIRPRTAFELGRSLGVLPEDEVYDAYRAKVVVDRTMPLMDVLACFDVVRRPVVNAEAVERIAREAVEDAAHEQISKCDIRFNPLTLAQAAGLSMDDAKRAVRSGVRAAREAGASTEVPLCAVLSRRHGVDAAWELVRHIERDHGETYVGVDFASDELRHRTAEFRNVAKALAGLGLPLTIHTGEGVGADYVADAVRLPNVRRLGHALSLSEDPDLVAELREKRVTIEVCPTSNVRTGLVPSYAAHPARGWFEQGIRIAFCTDDPSLFDIDLDHELAVAREHMGFSEAELAQCQQWAAAAMFG